MKTLIALDGSTTKTGYAIYKVYENGKFTYKESGVIQPPKPKKKKTEKNTNKIKKENRTESMTLRMLFIFDAVFELLVKEKTLAYIVVEDTFLGRDANAYKWLCRLQGFLMGYAKVKNIVYESLYPTHWRSILGIKVRDGNHFYKRDEFKKISADYIQNVLKYNHITSEDEGEAVLIGRAYLIEKGFEEKQKMNENE